MFGMVVFCVFLWFSISVMIVDIVSVLVIMYNFVVYLFVVCLS